MPDERPASGLVVPTERAGEGLLLPQNVLKEMEHEQEIAEMARAAIPVRVCPAPVLPFLKCVWIRDHGGLDARGRPSGPRSGAWRCLYCGHPR